MKKQSLTLIFVLFFSKSALSHKIGKLEWCLNYTTTHLECVYKKQAECEQTLKSVQSFVNKNSSAAEKIFEKTKDNRDQKIDLHCSENMDLIRTDSSF